MKRHSEKGMALVITLMMLAIVTFMAVVFLSLSRRERANVKTAEDQINARMIADMGLDRAKTDLIAGMNNKVEEFLGQATNSPQFGLPAEQQHVAIANRAVQRALFAYDLRTSRNFFNPNGFRAADKNNPWNVGYYDTAGNVYDNRGDRLDPNSDNYYQHIANLQYDPRPPVIVTEGRTNDFRFYIDLNRNGMFDPSGVYEVTGVNNERYSANNLRVTSSGPFFAGLFAGDPEWIGVLERPDLPHSETNRFIGRYAYIMLPSGKSLDINFIHNMAAFDPGNPALKYSTGPTPRFSRNQGVGSWEMNMAGFLVDLHTNVWKPTLGFYQYRTNQASGFAFRDAVGLLQYRLNYSHTNLLTPQQIFGGSASNRWAADYVDMASDGPYVPYNQWYASARPNFELRNAGVNPDNDNDVRFWHGGERMQFTSEFPDVQRYFKLKTPAATAEQLAFYTDFTNAVSSTRTNTYDRYAYYRFLAQMGADSKPALQGKIHLNFVNEPGTISTNLIPWVTNSSTLGIMPSLIVRSNTTVPITRNDGGQEFVQQQNNLTNFFLIAADAMLKASLVTNVYRDDFGKWRTNYTIGSSYFDNPSLNTVWRDPMRRRYIVATPVRPDISITNIQLYHRPNLPSAWRPNDNTYTNAEYTAAVHRILQLAANIYDSMTNNAGRTGRPQITGSKPDSPSDPYFPSVFRPIYNITPTNIVIVGWQPENTADFAMNAVSAVDRFRSPSQYFTNQNVSITNVSFYGQPWVIGAKKGWPNFNEFSMMTFAQITRKLEMRKTLAEAQAGTKINLTNYTDIASRTRQIYMIGVSNVLGMEAWNSYFRTNQRNMRLVAEVQVDYGIERVLERDQNSNVVRTLQIPLPAGTQSRRIVKSMLTEDWPGRKSGPGKSGDMELDKAFPNSPTPTTAVKGGSDFRVPIYTNLIVLTNSEYGDFPTPHFFGYPPSFESLTNTPDLRINVTNRLRYLAVDTKENRVLDYVTFDNVVTAIDLDVALKGEQNAANDAFGAGGPGSILNPAMYWDTRPEAKGGTPREVTHGVMRQIETGAGFIKPMPNVWRDYSAFDTTDLQIKEFNDYINGNLTNPVIKTNITRQVPFSPTRLMKLVSAYQANDPFVHYMIDDLKSPLIVTRPEIVTPSQNPFTNPELGHRNTRRQAVRVDGLHGVQFQDPRIAESDDWQFPIAKLDDPNVNAAYGIPNFGYRFPNIGALGQIHRGTPWQTVYLKAAAAPNLVDLALQANVATWYKWSGSYGTHPTNDWKLVGLFTTAMTENAARGLLSVNAYGTAAWSAVLSGVPVISNSWSNARYNQNPALQPRFGIPRNANDTVGAEDIRIEPGSIQLSNIVRNINAYRATRPMGLFAYMGEVLGSPMLSVGNNMFNGNLQGSPYMNFNDAQIKTRDGITDWHAFTDDALEAIPQRILSLLKDDEPRVTIYCFGQTLKPAPRSYITSADFYNLCVNYQVTGEYVTKAVVRIEGDFDPKDWSIDNDNTISDAQKTAWRQQRAPLRAVVESFEVLAPFE